MGMMMMMRGSGGGIRGGVLVLAVVLASCTIVERSPEPRGRSVGRHARGKGFGRAERHAVHAYYADAGRRGCPPGLAKKHNGCLPPGQAKKRYVIGQPLPAGVRVHPLPRELEIRIGVPPPGYYYGVVDGDVVKLVVGTMLVVDAIVGMAS